MDVNLSVDVHLYEILTTEERGKNSKFLLVLVLVFVFLMPGMEHSRQVLYC